MNLAEKLAAAYLRLNGFLLLPHFTVFNGNQHNHIDLIGLRAANSQERIGDLTLPIDEKLFTALTKHISNAKSLHIAIAAEVRTNNDRSSPSKEHIDYVKEFVGGLDVHKLAFYNGTHEININNDTLDIGMRYAGLWIQDRIDQMLNSKLSLTKTGSWTWSEAFLSDLLALRQLNLLTNDRNI